MKLKPYKVEIDINVYEKKANINGIDKFFGLYESRSYIFSIMDICIVCAIHKAKEYLEDFYKGKYIDWLRIDADEQPIVSIFMNEDYDEYY